MEENLLKILSNDTPIFRDGGGAPVGDRTRAARFYLRKWMPTPTAGITGTFGS
jgi:hypothetical protein